MLAEDARRRDRRDRRPAATPRCSTSGNELVVSQLGHRRRRRPSRPSACWSTTTTARIPACRRPRSLAEAGSDGGDRHAGALLRARDGRPEPCCLLPRSSTAHGVRDHHQRARGRRCAATGNELRRHVGSDYGAGRSERAVDQVVVEHGTLPIDELYHALQAALGQSRRGRLRSADRRPAADRDRATRHGTLPAVPHRRRGRRPQHPRRDLRRAAAVKGSVTAPRERKVSRPKAAGKYTAQSRSSAVPAS